MTYGYIRVSSDRQTVENQRYEIRRFCRSRGLPPVDGWIEETVSGTAAWNKRGLGELLGRVVSGDLIICSELSRLGRSLYMIMEILSYCMARDVKVWTVKDGFRLGDDIQSKVLAFAFGLSAEIERNLISQRTREALARRRAEGMTLGRPKGSRTSLDRLKLAARRDEILDMLAAGMTRKSIAAALGVDVGTLRRYLRRH
ncbi:MAG: master DNA invertase Mpi family serine-type recombinase [Paramuribaculum sp.]|nr:master DNA invertase Mpi family serine-type recombinase [Paramuribaculum sp.]MDE7151547.1 master DNA invertase Mpi family serine-type recombinase [Candidatus Amulumruptor sp.]MDE7238061.1 master DNA invertase Mpi family serine-type recombinase [Paramuribaculum sp.]